MFSSILYHVSSLAMHSKSFVWDEPTWTALSTLTLSGAFVTCHDVYKVLSVLSWVSTMLASPVWLHWLSYNIICSSFIPCASHHPQFHNHIQIACLFRFNCRCKGPDSILSMFQAIINVMLIILFWDGIIS